MHWLDIIILVVLAIGAAMGFWTGLLWQVARAISLVVSAYLAILTNAAVADWLTNQWQDLSPAFARIIAFIGVFVLVYAILYAITLLIHEAIKASKLELMDRILGAIFGAAKMAAVISCICAVVAALAIPTIKDWFDQATLAPAMARGTQTVVGWIPKSYRDRIDEGITQIRDQLQQRIADAAEDALKDAPAKK
ncbi:MAG: CvpA family protein [Planctomycetes bacterium]|nr:CvpA family protein [Planctomycetota bacterium]